MKKTIVLFFIIIALITSTSVCASSNYEDLSEEYAKEIAATVDGTISKAEVRAKFCELIDLWHLNTNIYSDVGTFSKDKEWRMDINANIKYGTKKDGGSTTCLGFAKYVFAYLFGIYSLNDSQIRKSYDLSYTGFINNNVQPGAYIQGNGHTLIVFAYDQNFITIFDGNWGRNVNKNSYIKVAKYSWDNILERLNGKCEKIVMPNDEFYHTCPNELNENNYATINGVLGACRVCKNAYNWQSSFVRIKNKICNLKDNKQKYKVGLYKAPYQDAAKYSSNKVIKSITVLGTVTNAYGNVWYAVDYCDNSGKINYTAYVYSKTLEDNYIITTSENQSYNSYNSAPSETIHKHNYNYNNGMCYCGAQKTKTQQTNGNSTLNINLTRYPVQHTQGNNFGLRGTISSNYSIKKVYGYIIQDGNTVQSSEDTINSKSVDVRNKNLNNQLIFDRLTPGNYSLVVNAIDASGNSITVTKYFTVLGQTVRDESILSINLDRYPSRLNAGSSFGLRGSVSSNYSISSVRGYVINSNGQTVLSSKDAPNSTYMDIRYASLNNDLVFNNLSAGDYTFKVMAVDTSGKTVECVKYFTVVSQSSSNNSTLSVNLDRYPVVLNLGSSFGLRGSVTSNCNISVVRGYVINSNGQTVLSSKDAPNSTYMDIRYASLNNDLIFNNLSTGDYTMKVTAVDTSGKTVEVTKNFTVKAKQNYTDNSPNGTGVTGYVAIPSSWDNLSIRTGPSTNYQIIGSMNNGVSCTVYPNKTVNGWYYVNYNGIWGYASGRQININNNNAVSDTRVGIVNIPSSWDNLSIRTGPSTNYQIIGSMNNGVSCAVYQSKTSNGWYYVEYNGVAGYAAGNRINLQ